MAAPVKRFSVAAEFPIKITKWKIRKGQQVTKGNICCLYSTKENDNEKFKASHDGVIGEIRANEGEQLAVGDVLFTVEGCSHPTVMKDMCADCGADLRLENSTAGNRKEDVSASVAMIHSIPELIVSEELAQELGQEDEKRLLKSRKLVLLVDLDQTLIHTTNDNIPPNLKDVHHFQLWHGSQLLWYHTRLRPYTQHFLERVSKCFELHICTFGVRIYAHTIAKILDPDGKYFSHRILSRDECFNASSKTANLKALFPCGDGMVCIIDDREDVWNFSQNLVHVKPYRFFQGTADINAPPGLTKTEEDDKPVVHRVRRVSQSSTGSSESKDDKADVDGKDTTSKGNKKCSDSVKEVENRDGKSKEDNKTVDSVKKQGSEKKDEEVANSGGNQGQKKDLDSKEVTEGGKDMEATEGGKDMEATEGGKDMEATEGGKDMEVTEGGKDMEVTEVGKDMTVTEGGKDMETKDDDGSTQVSDDDLFGEIDDIDMDDEDDEVKKDGVGGETNSGNIEEKVPEKIVKSGEKIKDSTENIDKTTEVKDETKLGDTSEGNTKEGMVIESQTDNKNIRKEEAAVENTGKCMKEKTEKAVESKQQSNKVADGNAPEKEKDGELIEWDDEDDYLLHLEEILTNIHKAFYDMHDQMKAKELDGKKPEKQQTNAEEENPKNVKVEQKCEDVKVEQKCADVKVEQKCEDVKVEQKCEDVKVGQKCEDVKVGQKCEDVKVEQKCDDVKEKDKQSDVEGKPSLKNIIPYMKKKVLKGSNIVFSSIIPTNMQREKHRAYVVAKALGANVQQELVTKRNEKDKNKFTTHLVAARHGTLKVRTAMKYKTIQLVNVDWLWSCTERWEKVEESLFPLTGEAETPDRCSPDITKMSVKDSRKRKREKAEESGETRKKSKQNDDDDEEGMEEDMDVNAAGESEEVKAGALGSRQDRFSLTYNPLYAFSDDDLAFMDKEVDDEIGTDEDESSEEEDDRNERLRKQVLKMDAIVEQSSSEDSMTGDMPRGWGLQRKLSPKSSSSSDTSSPEPVGPEYESETDQDKFEKIMEAFGPDTENSDDDGSIGSVDDEIAEAVVKEFLS